MTARGVRYVVACQCTGHFRDLAYIDDMRRTGGELLVDKAPSTSGQKFVGPEPRSDTEVDRRAARWQEVEYTENGTSWVIRCNDCFEQAQINRKNLVRIADRLAALPVKVLPEVTSTRGRFTALLRQLSVAGYLPLDVLVRGLSEN